MGYKVDSRLREPRLLDSSGCGMRANATYAPFRPPRHRQRLTTHREPGKGLQILLSRTQAGQGRKVKQEQEQISRNHVQAFSGASVY